MLVAIKHDSNHRFMANLQKMTEIDAFYILTFFSNAAPKEINESVLPTPSIL